MEGNLSELILKFKSSKFFFIMFFHHSHIHYQDISPFSSIHLNITAESHIRISKIIQIVQK